MNNEKNSNIINKLYPCVVLGCLRFFGNPGVSGYSSGKPAPQRSRVAVKPRAFGGYKRVGSVGRFR